MNIRYVANLDGVVWERISEIFDAVGWGRRNPTNLQQAFQKSTCVRIAYENEKIVGFGRTVDDGQYYALIVDLLVDPEYQRQGIGTAILQGLKDDLDGYVFTSLTATIGKEAFYQKQGWKEQTSAFFWPRSKQQEELYSSISEQGAATDVDNPRR